MNEHDVAGAAPHSTEARDTREAERVLEALQAQYLEQHDARAVFTGAYLVITRAMRGALDARRFLDNAWVERYLVAFADLYLTALRHAGEEAGAASVPIPPAWQVTFETCRRPGVSPLTHLLLGVNAHVNRDLAFALCRVGIMECRHERYEDHTRVNAVLSAAVNDLQSSVEALAPALATLDRVMSDWDERLACRAVAWARDRAWRQAVGLADAPPGMSAGVVGQIERRAYQYALLIARRPADQGW